MNPSSILWQNEGKTVVLLDLPRSIEEAQVLSSELTATDAANSKKLRRLISALPPASPFPTPEPKTGGSGQPALSPSAQVAELMTLAAVESALEEIKTSYSGPWRLPRLSSKPKPNPNPNPAPSPPPPTKNDPDPPPPPPPPPPPETSPSPPSPPNNPVSHLPASSHPEYHLPPSSHPLSGPLQTTRPTLLSTAPKFNLILLDPPWPNRSAKRKRRGVGAYQPQPDLTSIHTLLSQVPVATHLSEQDGIVAVWVTNASRFTDLLVDRVFGEWGVELVGEWVWLKVTTGGEPVVGVGSGWRKPWERLLIARRKGVGRGPVKGKVVVSVPDVHSRKPNLRGLFEAEGLVPRRYEAMEVFARNLTAGWWAWGDEVLLFQRKECWVEEGEGEEDDGGS